MAYHSILIVLLSLLWHEGHDISNEFNGYLILGYGVMWVIFFGYILSLASRQRNLRQDIQLLHQVLQEEAEEEASSG